MIVLPSFNCRRDDQKGVSPAWNDPIRSLHSHHAEFWPENLPENVLLERRHKARALRIRKLHCKCLLRRLVRPFRRLARRARIAAARLERN
ncbi:hypothetical protein [Roseibium sp.]|uniref:hypothetical protein n=1 Tax=Roseibium sp. TaxID=1936156 RepID=UPI00326445C4